MFCLSQLACVVISVIAVLRMCIVTGAKHTYMYAVGVEPVLFCSAPTWTTTHPRATIV
jgi:hypothetical protein